MPALDFTEIPLPTSGHLRDTFELFARDCLEYLGYVVLNGPDRGADGGRDLIVEEIRTGVGGETSVRWLVSCKHNAHSGASVTATDELDVEDRLRTHNCTGFLGFYSTLPSSGLTTKLAGARSRYEHAIFDSAKIEKRLLSSKPGMALARRYFPKSMEIWQREHSGPAAIFGEETDLHCNYCSRSLLNPKPHGIVVLWHPYDSEHTHEHRTEHIYWCCKGHCDDRLRQRLRDQKLIDGWKDVRDLTVPTIYIQWVMGILNRLQEGEVWSPKAFDKGKDLLINLFPHVARNLTEEDEERVATLGLLPSILGGLGE